MATLPSRVRPGGRIWSELERFFVQNWATLRIVVRRGFGLLVCVGQIPRDGRDLLDAGLARQAGGRLSHLS